MRLLNKLPHPKYFLITGFVGLFITAFLGYSASPREQISWYDMSWSPDGSKLAFIPVEDSHTADLFVIDADGTNPVRLIDQGDVDFLPIRWSPDSTTLYYYLNVNVHAVGSFDENSWFQIPVNPEVSSIDPYQNPVATQDEIEASIFTTSETDDYYVVSVCNAISVIGTWEGFEDECEKTLEVYDRETDELLWSFGRCRYNWHRFGNPCFLDHPFKYIIISLMVMGSGILVAILRLFRQPDQRKQKEKTKSR